MKNLPNNLSGCRTLLYGYGKSNRALVRLLNKEGAFISLYDEKKSAERLLEEAKEDGCEKIAIIGQEEKINADIIFRTPGIRPDVKKISEAVERGAILSSEVELFFERAKGKIYGITGSDGKTTTTSITGKILEKAFEKSGKRVFVGGNIGKPLVSFLDELTENDVTVAELSSFQLMTLGCSPSVVAITNITENHLDYHKDMREYVAAKSRIFSGKSCDRLVIGEKTLNIFKDNVLTKADKLFPKEITEISGNGEINLKNGGIYLCGERVLDTGEIKIPGQHNIENYMTSIGITKNDASFNDICEVAKTFSGAEHRMEFVRILNGVSFYNSSIDSTPSRSLVTLKCFQKPLTVIAGGYDKKLDYKEFAKILSQKADNVVLTGDTAEIIKNELDRLGYVNNFRIYMESDFEKAVVIAASVTKKSGKVLLSPASASFDAFTNFEERGRIFKNIVNSL